MPELRLASQTSWGWNSPSVCGRRAVLWNGLVVAIAGSLTESAALAATRCAQGRCREHEYLGLALGRIEPQERQVWEVLLHDTAAGADLHDQRPGRRQVVARFGQDAAHDVEPIGAARMRDPRLGRIF